MTALRFLTALAFLALVPAISHAQELAPGDTVVEDCVGTARVADGAFGLSRRTIPVRVKVIKRASGAYESFSFDPYSSVVNDVQLGGDGAYRNIGRRDGKPLTLFLLARVNDTEIENAKVRAVDVEVRVPIDYLIKTRLYCPTR